ncbi:MAG: nucleoside kinase, partial [Lentisphaerae bacterium]|nr:nucleoside kinase [Lentisphaerota bacterium]
MGLIKVTRELFPDDVLKTAYSIGEGVFCNLVGSLLSIREVKQIEIELRKWVEQDSPIQFIEHKDGYYHYLLGDMPIKIVYPAHTSTTLAEPFTIIPFSYGFIIDFADPISRSKEPLKPPLLLANSYEKSQRWLRNVGIEYFTDINKFILSGKSLTLLGLAEAVHEKRISDIADMIIKQRRALRVLIIAGPSSSGKTSFAQRISTQLYVNGLKTVALSMDDYYLSRDKVPLDDDGKYDFDCVEALDLPLLQQHIEQLIKGETVEAPVHDFIRSRRAKQTRTVSVGPEEILIIEGIHALDPILVPNINRNLLFKVYVSCLGGLSFDLYNRQPTTEVRLLRRLVRDDRFRGSHPEETFDMWASVR